MPGRLEGKVAVVTGGAQGIGRAIVEEYVREGARPAILDLDYSAAEHYAEELRGRAADARAYECDVADRTSVFAAAERVAADLGPIDVLVNNAGYDEFGFFVNTDEEMWKRVIGVNLIGVIACTHAVLPGMQERRSGRIVNTASEAGRVGSPGSSVYSGAKGGVIGFTKAIAAESARYGVTCNAVAPGPIETPLLMAAHMLGERGDRMIKGMVSKTVLGRLGQPEEVAATIAFLASDDASYVTGETLGVSGGMGRI